MKKVGGAVASLLVHLSLDHSLLSPGRGHCIVFLGKTLEPSQYLSPPVNCWRNLPNCRGMTCDGLASHPQRVEILLATSSFIN